MKTLFSVLIFLLGSSACSKNEYIMAEVTVAKKYSYLALGDSYTIGEQVLPADNFPNQTVKILKNRLEGIELPRIIATTGWTTDELEKGIVEASLIEPIRNDYDFVSLLIGVNNQYRGRTVENYETEFEELLLKAIRFAGGRTDRVVVLSIPDWGVTPFAQGRDRARIAGEIDAYNAANRKMAERYHIYYIDITPWTREAANDQRLLAPDGLHPSGIEYKRWAEKIAAFFLSKPGN